MQIPLDIDTGIAIPIGIAIPVSIMDGRYQPVVLRSTADALHQPTSIWRPNMAKRLYAQGDIVLELVEDAEPARGLMPEDADGAVVLARGELTGHRHAFHGGGVTLFRDDALARDLPRSLYVGHVTITAPSADLRHEEHATITLPAGTYRVRRQQEWEGNTTVLMWE
jgi:hypothetical protein